MSLWGIAAVASRVLLACDSSGAGYYESGAAEPPPPIRAWIDRDAELVDRSVGYGLGVFIEYHAGGQWRIDVACDTALSMVACSWLVVAEPLEGTITGAVTHDLEDSDDFELQPNSVGIDSITTDDTDGVSFSSAPGAGISLFTALDGYSESRFVYWVGDGAVHSGAPAVPFELQPSAP